jgi:hypothetical protein
MKLLIYFEINALKQATSYVKEFRFSHPWQLGVAYLPDGGAYLINEGYLPRRGHFIAH